MTYEFECQRGHLTVLKFSTIGKAIAHFESPDNADSYDEVTCGEDGCCLDAARLYGNSGTVFYGEGWDKPAPSGRQFTKGADPNKALSSAGPATIGRK